MIVKNEEKNIGRCLNSVRNIVDEIVVVDTGSQDNTIKVLKSMNDIKLFEIKWPDDFSKARNYSIEQTTGDYILVLDADEYMVSGTRSELEKMIKQNSIGRILLRNYFKKNNEVHESQIYISRFFPRDVRYVGAIHEQLNSDKHPRVDMDFIVKHDGYFETNKGERNIPLLIIQLKKNPNDPYYLYQLGKELRINNQFLQSINFLKKSYKLVNTNASYYHDLVLELINCGKELGDKDIFEVIKQNEMKLKRVTDFHFAKGMFFMDYCLKNLHSANSLIMEIEKSFLTCLTLAQEEFIEYVKGTSSFLASYNLGVYYEVTGNMKKAFHYYENSSLEGYNQALKRLELLNSGV